MTQDFYFAAAVPITCLIMLAVGCMVWMVGFLIHGRNKDNRIDNI